MLRARTPLMLASASLLTLTACVDPNNPQPERNRTAEGAVIGGLIGGVAGAATGDNGLGRAIGGAAIGAAAGGLIGSQLDKQARELEASMDSRVSVVNTGNELIVTMPQDILFDVDSTYVNPVLRDDLRTLAGSLNDYPNTTVDVIGHTDNTGTAAYNQNLSSRRADAVAGILTGAGVRSSRIRAYGRGESQPVASNLSPEGRRQNRRVEIVIRPNA
ncbi:hypothetical protein DDZ14_10930 [Maritimibacter sp. 55A14]|uniref:OmpA family protein n=1 Tax=Maritimibacter sp. 55A14 TaxID=2174844 RepID=UPI000D60841E|nr:OmpA family protein [Maritimibacter sp. 55A14]PWE32239.1 hypothetical protein DDZ14_10930 [Maritimibacter sp. 55A14]